jgi:hypothetical protein
MAYLFFGNRTAFKSPRKKRAATHLCTGIRINIDKNVLLCAIWDLMKTLLDVAYTSQRTRSQIAKAITVVKKTCAEEIYKKNQKIGLIGMSLLHENNIDADYLLNSLKNLLTCIHPTI